MAEKYYLEALKGSEKSKATYNLIYLYQIQNQSSKAAELLNSSPELKNDAELLYNIALSYDNAKNNTEAEKY